MIRDLFSTATFKQSQITIVGTILNGGLGALFYIILARLLGPSDFGLLTIAITTLVLISDIADVGTNTGLVKFVSLNLSKDVDKAYKFLKLSFEIKLTTWIISFLVVFTLAPFLAIDIFHKPQLVLYLRLASFGVGGALLFTFVTSSLQAYQKYFMWSVVNISTNFLRLSLILILAYLTALNVTNGLLIYIILPFFGFFVGLFILPTRKIIQSSNELSLAKALFNYNLPVAIFTIIASFSARLDTFLTASLLSSKDVGIYGVSNQLVQVMPQLVSALGLVASPKFASFHTNEQMITYFKKFQLLVLGLCILGIIIIPLLIYLIPLILGRQYQQAVNPFIFLFLGQLIFLFSIPIHHSVIFYFGKPDLFIWISVGHLLIMGLLGYFMISQFGVIGASLTVLIGMIFNLLYPAIWLFFRLKKQT